MKKFKELRAKYPDFIYEKYEVKETNDLMILTFYFNIPNLAEFTPTIEINKKDIINNNKIFIDYLVFHIGLVELISYYKSVCSSNVIIKAGFLNEEQIEWFKKLIYNGLGEFLYINNINITKQDLVNIKIENHDQLHFNINYEGNGNLIPIGGGKDSNVTLELLKKFNNTPFVINEKIIHKNCIEASGYTNHIHVKRQIDSTLLDLNKQGFLNGHTPFSALVAFVSYLVSYLSNKKYIVLSNESSANEETIIGSGVNHQYSKSYEFEKDFNNYTKKYFKIDLHYFSLLRPLNELQISALFNDYDKYHYVFRSCNLGSKEKNWPWCCNCAKCLFVYIILSPFMEPKKLENIFGENLLNKEELLIIFKELLGKTDKKPFECVGTFEEVRYATIKAMKKYDKLPYLLQFYKDNYSDQVDEKLLYQYNEDHNLPEIYDTIVKEKLNLCIEKY